MSLIDLLQDDGHQLKQKANIRGGEYAGPCPFCGGNDRFIVWPQDRGGRYWCRGCNKRGDSIQYLRDFRGLRYVEACEILGLQPRLHSYTAIRPIKPIFTPKVATMPELIWTSEAGTFLERCQQYLWSDQGKDAHDFLYNEKGLTKDTIIHAALGWNPAEAYLSRGSWGLPNELNEKGQPKKLWLPRGVVIPCIENGHVSRLRIRRDDPNAVPRYYVAPGSSMGSMSWGLDKKILIIIESELDGLLVYQEAGDMVGIVALGSAQVKPDAPTHALLCNADLILVALDTDAAGGKAAWTFWPGTYGDKVKRWPCIMGKDPSDAWQQGLDIRAWVMTGAADLMRGNNAVCHEDAIKPLPPVDEFNSTGYVVV